MVGVGEGSSALSLCSRQWDIGEAEVGLDGGLRWEIRRDVRVNAPRSILRCAAHSFHAARLGRP